MAVSVVFLLAANILVLIVYDMIQNMHEENLAMQLAAVHDRADLEFTNDDSSRRRIKEF